jgi:glycine/D-amino acid oxidase-like deaminating enzyme/nitrite reductase/ring-hydroxylating ferredoxin subunit
MKTSERSQSIWKATAPLLEFPALTEDTRADVCVVGAGIAGMSAAYLLARAGRRVVVLDDNAVGGGETGQTTAHLSSALDDRYFAIERMHGEDGARLAYESHQAAIDRVRQIAADEGIDCDYEQLDGYLFLAPHDTTDLLDRERDAAHRAGYTDVERLERAPISTFDTGPCLRFPRQARFHPLKYLEGLARAVQRDGGRIYTGTHAVEVEGGSPTRVTVREGHTVTADAVVVATNTPFNDRVAIHTKQAPYRTFVIGARVPSGSVPDALYWDTLEMYHYVRLQPDYAGNGTGDLLIVGGEDHKTGHADDAEDRYHRLEAWTRARFPVEEVEFRWSGQVMEPADLMAFIGRNPPDPEQLATGGSDNVYIATGDSGHGMTHGTIAGILISDLILGRENAWASLYDPSRVTLDVGALKEFAHENLDVARSYTEWVRGADIETESADQIAPGTGRILRRGAAPIAAYRDEAGVLHERSAVCTHLGCIIHWNTEERSWDCPCHGSRFAPTGEVLNGPAPVALKPVSDEVSR